MRWALGSVQSTRNTETNDRQIAGEVVDYLITMYRNASENLRHSRRRSRRLGSGRKVVGGGRPVVQKDRRRRRAVVGLRSVRRAGPGVVVRRTTWSTTCIALVVLSSARRRVPRRSIVFKDSRPGPSECGWKPCNPRPERLCPQDPPPTRSGVAESLPLLSTAVVLVLFSRWRRAVSRMRGA